MSGLVVDLFLVLVFSVRSDRLEFDPYAARHGAGRDLAEVGSEGHEGQTEFNRVCNAGRGFPGEPPAVWWKKSV